MHTLITRCVDTDDFRDQPAGTVTELFSTYRMSKDSNSVAKMKRRREQKILLII